MQPVKVVQHETGAESGRAPLVHVVIDPLRFLPEFVARLIQPPVVLKIMHAYLEAVARQLLTQLARNAIVPFRDEVEGRPEAVLHLHFHQLPALVQPDLAFDIVRQDEREFFPLGPARPIFRRLFRARHNRPGIGHAMAQA